LRAAQHGQRDSVASLTLARDEVLVVLVLRLFLPESWTSKRSRLERASLCSAAFEIPIARLITTAWPVGRIAHGAFAKVQNMHGDWASGCLSGRS
jgi:hypothetical protein